MGNELIPVSGSDYPAHEPVGSHSSTTTSFRLEHFLVILKKFWWIPVLTLAIGVGVGIQLVKKMEPVYLSSSKMWDPGKVHLPDQSVYSADANNPFGTQMQLLQSDKMRAAAMERLAAMTNYAGYFTNGAAPMVNVRVSQVPQSSILEIDATGSKPDFIGAYLNALMASFLEYDKQVRNEISSMTQDSINDAMQAREQELKTEQDALVAYERTNSVVILQQEQSVAGGYLEKLQTQLSDLVLQSNLLMKAKMLSEQAGANTNNPISLAAINALIPGDSAGGSSPGTVGSGTGASGQNNPTTSLAMMKQERNDLAKVLEPNSRKLADLDEDIKQAEELDKINRRDAFERLSAAITANQIKIQYVKDSITEWQGKVTEANTRLAQADGLKVNIQRTQAVYDHLTSLSENLGISRSIDQESLAILEAATPPYRSFKAERMHLGMAGAGGFAGGLVIVFLIGLRDDRFKSVTEVNTVLGDAVVGMLPRVNQDKSGNPKLLQPNDTRHAYAESYRSLRSALRFLEMDKDHPKTLLITSATPNEGKSTVSANLAHTLAMAGYRVLLVDADLRKGRLHNLLGLRKETGLMELLSGICSLEQALQKDSFPNLSFISCGKSEENPGDLLVSVQLDQYLDRWRHEYDYVLIDSSPVLAAADAGSLAPRMDGTLFLVRSHYSSARVTREALEMLAQRRANIIGVVFNMVNSSDRSHYHYKYADYYTKPDSD